MIIASLFAIILTILTTLCFAVCATKKSRNSSTKNHSEKPPQSYVLMNRRRSDSAPKPSRPSCEQTMPTSQSPKPSGSRTSGDKKKHVLRRSRSRVSSEAASNAGNHHNTSKRKSIRTVAIGSAAQPKPLHPEKSQKSLCADKTQSESLAASPSNKASPTPVAANANPHKTEESEDECELKPIDLKLLDEKKPAYPRTPAHLQHTLVVPEEKVQHLGELDKVLQARKAALQKEIEDMSSTHEFDKPGCPVSAENAGPINSKRHVVIAENKCQRYTIAGDEVEEAPTQSEAFDFTPIL